MNRSALALSGEVDSADMFDLGYQNSWTDKFRPAPREVKTLNHLRFAAITGRRLKIKREGKYLIINPDCGKQTEDEARFDPAFTGSGKFNRELNKTPLPEGFWSWSDIIIGVMDACGLTQEQLGHRLGCLQGAISYSITKGAPLQECARAKLIELAQDCGLVDIKGDDYGLY